MLKLFNESILLLNPEYNYFFIVNIKDTELSGQRNETLINLFCKNKMVNPYIDVDKKPILNDYIINSNVYYLYTLKYGGLCKTKTETEQIRFDNFCLTFENIIKSEDFDNKKTICIDYGNLIAEPGANYELYLKYLTKICDKYKLNIYFYINKKYKLLNNINNSKIESDISIESIKCPYVKLTIDDITKII